MWLLHGDANFLGSLLQDKEVVQRWCEMLEQAQRPATLLKLCGAVVCLEELHGVGYMDEYRASLFDIGDRFLSLPLSSEVEEVQWVLKEQHSDVLERLAAGEFAAFIASQVASREAGGSRQGAGGRRQLLVVVGDKW